MIKKILMIIIPGLPWILSGFLLLSRSIPRFLAPHQTGRELLTLFAFFFTFVLLGLIKYRFIFSRSVSRQLVTTKEFLIHRSAKRYLRNSFELKKIAAYFSMTLLSIFLKTRISSEFILFLIRTAVGTALLTSGLAYLKNLKQIYVHD